jgi:hypothetical protein
MIYKIIDGVSTPMSENELADYNSRRPDFHIEAEFIRNQRNRLLSGTDWMALSDNTMTPAWASYRQALRDITAQEGFPYSVVWPTKPE